MIEARDPMTALRPLYVPPEPALWLPAPGWWIAGAVCLAVVAAGLFLWWRRTARYRRARAELDGIRRAFRRDDDAARAWRQVSRLLKRVALSIDARDRVASLSGEAWLVYLSERGGAPFLGGSGAASFGNELYRAQGTDVEDPARLFTAAERWIKKVLT